MTGLGAVLWMTVLGSVVIANRAAVWQSSQLKREAQQTLLVLKHLLDQLSLVCSRGCFLLLSKVSFSPHSRGD